MSTITLEVTPDQLAKIQAIIAPAQDKETHICGVLDASSSMLACYDSTLEAYNAFVEEVEKNKELGGKTYLSSLIFSSIKVAFTSAHSVYAKLSKLNRDTYKPSGGTPLYDAIDKAITRLEAWDTPGGDKSFLVSIFTDGEENASVIKGSALSEKIRRLQATGRWTFTVAGANISLDDLSEKIGISRNNMVSFAATNRGFNQMGHMHVNSTNSYLQSRNAGASASVDFYAAPQADPATVREIVEQARLAAEAQNSTQAVPCGPKDEDQS